ncbi:MAG: hypothetical protein DRP65_04535 [Planctomycetota bacterium]|nr:MAG: hypothetical protein DRP65_04535 [Planctomycetota bacterium]
MVTSLPEKVCDINVGFSVFVQISIKQSLNPDHLRCKSPDMIHREFWTILPAYDMVRLVYAQAAAVHNKLAHQTH